MTREGSLASLSNHHTTQGALSERRNNAKRKLNVKNKLRDSLFWIKSLIPIRKTASCRPSCWYSLEQSSEFAFSLCAGRYKPYNFFFSSRRNRNHQKVLLGSFLQPFSFLKTLLLFNWQTNLHSYHSNGFFNISTFLCYLTLKLSLWKDSRGTI